MGVAIAIKIDDSEVRSLLKRLEKKTSNLKPVMEVIGETIRASIQKNFLVGGRYSRVGSKKGGSKRWKTLSPVTIARKRNKDKVLIEARILMESIKPKAYKDRVVVGTDKKYAAVHQFGIGRRSSLKSRRIMPAIPARPYMVIQDEDMREIKKVIKDFIAET